MMLLAQIYEASTGNFSLPHKILIAVSDAIPKKYFNFSRAWSIMFHVVLGGFVLICDSNFQNCIQKFHA
jgi:hypothetical protein